MHYKNQNAEQPPHGDRQGRKKFNTKNMKKIEMNQMEGIEGGKYQAWMGVACGAGLAVSIFTGGLGALIFGPSTVGMCMATALS